MAFSPKLDNYVRFWLNNMLDTLEKRLGADCVAIVGPILPGLDARVRKAIEDLKATSPYATSPPPTQDHVAIVLHTHGGVIEVVERIVTTIRHHYKQVTFVIPDLALSAGTVFAMSGDHIFMDYYSVLGPIDPQIQRADGVLVPALGYLIQYEKLIDKAKNQMLTTPELALIDKLDLAELQQYRDQKELSVELLKRWLTTYKFKDWTVTATRQVPVTPEMRTERAEHIARQLLDPERWHSHGRGISMATLRDDSTDGLNVKIEDFSSDPDLNTSVQNYFGCLMEYIQGGGYQSFIHTRMFF